MNADSLRKVLDLEKQKGYADTAVFGGLDKFLKNWSAQAEESADSPQKLARFRKLFKTSYGDMTTEERREWVEDVLASESPDRAVMYGVVRVLMRAVEARDRYARGHADQVARVATAIAQEMGCSEETTEGVRIASRVHDIGRVSISDMILLKPGPLTELEAEIVRTHPVVGAQILDALEFPWAVKPAVRYHHERLDGSGYPEGLMGDEIPLAARIVAVADVMAAMVSDRPHRRALPKEEALAELATNAGVVYDASAVGALERVAQRGVI